MSYYSDTSDDPTPQPTPAPPTAWQPSLALVALIVAIAGLFLPGGIDFDKIKPDPKPIPPFVEPEPKPQPKPVIDITKTEGAWIVVVEQTEKRTLEQAKLMRDLPFWKSLESRGLKWRHYDYDADDAVEFRKLSDDVGLPLVCPIIKNLVHSVLGHRQSRCQPCSRGLPCNQLYFLCSCNTQAIAKSYWQAMARLLPQSLLHFGL